MLTVCIPSGRKPVTAFRHWFLNEDVEKKLYHDGEAESNHLGKGSEN